MRAQIVLVERKLMYRLSPCYERCAAEVSVKYEFSAHSLCLEFLYECLLQERLIVVVSRKENGDGNSFVMP